MIKVKKRILKNLVRGIEFNSEEKTIVYFLWIPIFIISKKISLP